MQKVRRYSTGVARGAMLAVLGLLVLPATTEAGKGGGQRREQRATHQRVPSRIRGLVPRRDDGGWGGIHGWCCQ